MMINSTTTMGQEHSFKPGWIDRLNNWVEELPIRPWIFYLVLGFVLIAVQLFVLWLEGGLQDAEILPVILFNGLFTPYLLALIYFLDHQAAKSLHSMSPVLDMTESEFEQYEYELTNMPARASLLAGLAMMVAAILMEQLWIEPARYAALGQIPMFAGVFQIVDKSSAFLFGVVIYHTIRQLHLANTISLTRTHQADGHARQLSNFGPLRAFSRLTASTAVGLVAGVYGWLLINPELLGDPLIFAFVGLISILAAAVFATPLFGVHRLMEREKERALHALDLDFETVFSKFNKQFHNGNFVETERLHGTIASLEIQQNRITAVPTWPWKPETAHFVLAAIALPLILMILGFLVERAFGW